MTESTSRTGIWGKRLAAGLLAAMLACTTILVAPTVQAHAAGASDGSTTTKASASAKKAKKSKKKKGNCDKYIGLGKKYWVLATARKPLVKVYKSKSTGSRVLGTFKRNATVVVKTKGMKQGRKYTWLKVGMPKGSSGYVQFSKVKLDKLDVETFGLEGKSKTDKKRIKVCQFGLPYLGTRFVMGGGSLTRGIDCSTFVRTAMRRSGVKVPAYALAADLARTGKGIARKNLKPGDMVFYHTSTESRISHSSIYLGKGFIINSSGHHGKVYPTGGIRISKIDYRWPRASKFRNVIGG